MMRMLRSIGTIAGGQLRRHWLGGEIIWLAGLPIVIIYVLGLALQGAFGAGFTPAEPFAVAVSGESRTAAEIAESLRSQPELFEAAMAEDALTARRSVLERESKAAVIVPDNFPDEAIVVVAAPGSVVAEILYEILSDLAWQFHDSIGREQGAAVQLSTTPVAQHGDDEPNAPDGATDGSGLNAFDFYSFALTSMFIMFAVHTAMTGCARDRATGAYARTRAFGVSKGTYLFAGYASGVQIGVLFAALMAVLTKLLFGVVWASGWLGILAWIVLTVAGAIGITAISFLLMTLIPSNPKTLDNAGGVVFTLLILVGGSTMLPGMPAWFSSAFGWLPNRALMDGYFTLASGAGFAGIAGELTTLGAAAAAAIACAMLASFYTMKGEG